MKGFEPGTIMLGCDRMVDRAGFPKTDRYGNPMFHMPKPIRYQKHGGNQMKTMLVTDDDGVERKVHQVVMNPEVPIYRGISASLARYMRGQTRRAQRKLMAKKLSERKLEHIKIEATPC